MKLEYKKRLLVGELIEVPHKGFIVYAGMPGESAYPVAVGVAGQHAYNL